MTSRNDSLFERARKHIPAGVNSPVRAFRAVGGTPPFFERASGPHLWDADGKRYIDYVGSWGPMVLGHTHPHVVEAVQAAASRALSFGAPTESEIDLAEAICAVLKVQCAIQTRPFETLIDGLKDGTGNAIIAGFDLEKAPAEGLIASQTYLKIPGRFVVPKDSDFDPGSRGSRQLVGVLCGSAHAAYLSRFFPDLPTACFSRRPDLLAGLKTGRFAAVFGDALTLSFWLNGAESEDCCRFIGGPYLDDRFFGAGLAIVMRTEDRALKFAIDYALREVHRAGTYEELYLRYFPVGLF